MSAPARAAALDDLRSALGEQSVLSAEADIARVLRDNSWLSPLLAAEAARRQATDGPTLGALAVAAPRTEEEVVRLAEVCVAHRLPATPRGAGTSNFGLISPEPGGILVDLRQLRGGGSCREGAVTALAGETLGRMERLAEGEGREVTVLTTTYMTATVGGWVAGGHVGLGSSLHGSVWDGNVTGVRVVTFADRPAVRVLRGEEARPLLHTFGTAGLLTEVGMRTVPAREWAEAVCFFPSFSAACELVRVVSSEPVWQHKVVAAQEEPLMVAFTPLGEVMQPGAGVLTIVARSQLDELGGLAARLGGALVPWRRWAVREQGRPSIGLMVYGHRMLWVKKAYPRAAFLHVYFDPSDPDRYVARLKERYGDDVLLEMKYVRSPHMLGVLGFDREASLPAAVITIREGEAAGAVAEVMGFCRRAGIPFQNPHTNVLEESGLFPDVSEIVAFKAEVDPYNLLNPGRLRSARVRAA